MPSTCTQYYHKVFGGLTKLAHVKRVVLLGKPKHLLPGQLGHGDLHEPSVRIGVLVGTGQPWEGIVEPTMQKAVTGSAHRHGAAWACVYFVVRADEPGGATDRTELRPRDQAKLPTDYVSVAVVTAFLPGRAIVSAKEWVATDGDWIPGKDGSAHLSINSTVIPSVHLPIADRPHRLVAEIELGLRDERVLAISHLPRRADA